MEKDGLYHGKLNWKLSIDKKALELLKKELAAENASAMRLFTTGGCCSRFEITPVRKALAGDVIYNEGGIKIYIEKELDDNTSAIEIKFDKRKGLIIELINRENLNKDNS